MCVACRTVRVNGILLHEQGCPYQPKSCKWCGQRFTPKMAGQICCDDSCYRSFYDLPDADD